MKTDKSIVKPTLLRLLMPLFHNLNKEIINVNGNIDLKSQREYCASSNMSKNNEIYEQGDHVETLGDWLDKHANSNSEDIVKLRDFICIYIS